MKPKRTTGRPRIPGLVVKSITITGTDIETLRDLGLGGISQGIRDLARRERERRAAK